MNATHLSYAEALAAAADRKEGDGGGGCIDVRSPAHVRAAQTKRAKFKALQAERLAALRGEA